MWQRIVQHNKHSCDDLIWKPQKSKRRKQWIKKWKKKQSQQKKKMKYKSIEKQHALA